jgi:dTDP-4-amino-4,6-dideoxygalactose transaminase
MIWRCDLSRQYIAFREPIEAAVRRVLESGRYTLGAEVAAFEREFAAYLKAPHAVSVANGTDGLILALRALGVRPGDEVITTPFTAIPSASAIVAAGARPVFADIDADTFLVDPASVVSRVTAKTRVVMPVHIFGNVLDVEGLARELPRDVKILEDACQAHGSTRSGRQAGTFGHAGVFSFYPTKNLGAYGDGGAVTTADATLAADLRLLRMYGMSDKDHTVRDGVNSRLDEIQAAILRVKLPHLDDMNRRRDAIAARYRAGLDPERFRHQVIPDGVRSNWHVYAVRFRGDRDRLVAALEAADVQTNVYYPLPLHLQEAHRHLGYRAGDLPRVEKLCEEVIALPMYPELDDATLDIVIERVNSCARAT